MRCYFTSCMTCMTCTTDRTPSLHLSNEMPPSTCYKYFTFFPSNISHSPLQPIAQLNDSYHLSLEQVVSTGHPVLWVNIIINLPPLKLRPIIINDNFFLLAKVSACNWVSFAKKDSKCHLQGNPKARWLNWNNCSVTIWAEPPLIFLSEEQKGDSAWITTNLWGGCSPNFWTSQSCSLSSNCFFFSVASIYSSLLRNLWSQPRPL